MAAWALGDGDDTAHRGRTGDSGFLRHAAPMTFVDMPAATLSANVLGMVGRDVRPVEAGHQIVEWGQIRSSRTQQDRIVLRVAVDVADRHIENHRVQQTIDIARRHMLAHDREHLRQ